MKQIKLTRAEAVRKYEAQLANKIKDKLLNETGEFEPEEALFMNRLTLKEILGPEIRNSFFNHKWIWQDLFRADHYNLKNLIPHIFDDIKHSFRWHTGRRDGWGQNLETYHNTEKGPCAVIGSGPSLDFFVEALSKQWAGGIVCSKSQYSTFRFHGRAPDYMVGFDWKDKPSEYAAPSHDYKKTKFCVLPSHSPELLQQWKGRRVYYRVFDPYINWYHEAMPIAYGDAIPTHILPFSCSISAEIQIARYVGYDPIFLFGCDLGPVGLKTYGNQAHWRKIDGKWQWQWSNPKDITRESIDKQWGALHKDYVESVISLLWLDAGNVIDCSMGQLNPLLPVEKGEDVIFNQGMGYANKHEVSKQVFRDRLAPWMAGQGLYWVEILEENNELSWKLVKMNPKDWEASLRMYIQGMTSLGIEINVDQEMARYKHWFDIYRKTGGLWKDTKEHWWNEKVEVSATG